MVLLSHQLRLSFERNQHCPFRPESYGGIVQSSCEKTVPTASQALATFGPSGLTQRCHSTYMVTWYCGYAFLAAGKLFQKVVFALQSRLQDFRGFDEVLLGGKLLAGVSPLQGGSTAVA